MRMLDNIRAVILIDRRYVGLIPWEWKDIDIEYLEQFGQEMPERAPEG